MKKPYYFALSLLVACILSPNFARCAESSAPSYSLDYPMITYNREIRVIVYASGIGYMSGFYAMDGKILQGITNGTNYVYLRASVYYDSVEEFNVLIYYSNRTIYDNITISIRFNENIKQNDVLSPSLIFWSNYWCVITFSMIALVGIVIIPKISGDKSENDEIIAHNRNEHDSIFISNGSVRDICFDDDGNYICDSELPTLKSVGFEGDS